MKYRCLVLDHDDTVVNSTATIHFPCFVEYLHRYRPEVREYTLEEYFQKNFYPGVVALFCEELAMGPEECKFEQAYWNQYVKCHVPEAYDGVKEILKKHRDEGGYICVVSHSYRENILRDYRENGLPEPDLVFGWDDPPEKRKPSTWPLETIMRTLKLRPDELLVMDDLKPGCDMANKAGVAFAAAGWSNDIKEIEDFMRSNACWYFKTVAELKAFLDEA